MKIYRLDALWDNYVFLLHDPVTATAAVVDPAEVEPVLAKLTAVGARLTAIFNTHHHGDHVGGNQALLQRYPDAVVYGGAGDRGRIPGQQVYLQGGDTVTFGGVRPRCFLFPVIPAPTLPTTFPPWQTMPGASCFVEIRCLPGAVAAYLRAPQPKW
jgi:hydroxyacylglutathione hydrolase